MFEFTPHFLLVEQTHVSVSGDCDGTIETEHLIIKSPNYPHNYNSNTTCNWMFESAETQRKMEFEIEELFLQDGTGPGICDYDWLEVNNLDGNVPVKYCDSIPKIPIRSTGNIVNLSFHSDPSIEDKGFKISYRAVGRYFLKNTRM